MTREFYFSSPAYTGVVVVRGGVVVSGMHTLRWAWGRDWDWLVAYATTRWPGQFTAKEITW